MLKLLTSRAIVPVSVAVTGFVVVCYILLYSSIKAEMVKSSVKYETNMTEALIKSITHTMLKDDREVLRNIIANVGEMQGIEHLRIFNDKGIVMFSRDGWVLSHMVNKQASGCIQCHSKSSPGHVVKDMEPLSRTSSCRELTVNRRREGWKKSN